MQLNGIIRLTKDPEIRKKQTGETGEKLPNLLGTPPEKDTDFM